MDTGKDIASVNKVESCFGEDNACDAASVLAGLSLEERGQVLRQVQAQNNELFKSGVAPKLEIDFHADGNRVEYGVTLTNKGQSGEIYREAAVTDPASPDAGNFTRCRKLDTEGRVTEQHDCFSQVGKPDYTKDYKLTYGADGKLSSVQENDSNDVTVRMELDANGHTRTFDSSSHQITSHAEYGRAADGKVKWCWSNTDLGNGHDMQNFYKCGDDGQKVKSIDWVSMNNKLSMIADTDYSYDNAGNVKSNTTFYEFDEKGAVTVR
jgi:hypothetical protein